MSSKLLKQIKVKSTTVAETLKVLSHPQRLMILCYLADGDRTVSDIQELCEISQSYASQFLTRMKREGLLTSYREGSFIYYKIADPKILKLMASLQTIYCD